RRRRIFRWRIAARLLRQRRAAQFLRLRAGSARRSRQQSRCDRRRAGAGPVSAGREFPGRGDLLFRRRIHPVHRGSARGAARGVRRRHRAESLMAVLATSTEQSEAGGSEAVRSEVAKVEANNWRLTLAHVAPFLGILVLALLLPLVGN